ncbi:hypothetical protein I302_103732 [Kwoniella bestiolae CBS 10118]|uniref:Nitroreductase n=1 Tax=Kwoniella bestiolae CBS 10118 TaxID=1296100 RepID=A0A1B9G986_9TREE|nr:nitroreductase [Kwoniella bestiolae CBS 10118]OCF27592.1 nitroreductase [Kwoniella bestiolae CBS 10118]
MVANSNAFFEAVENRRSYYNLTKESPLSNDQLKSLVEKAVKFAPTSFNGQQSRAVLVTGKKHEEVWDAVLKAYIGTLGGNKEQEAFWTDKINTQYKAGYGTVLFFEDQDVINSFSGKMPYLSQHFPIWSENSAGILQYIVWTALEAEGYGASLQHFGGFVPQVQTDLTNLLEVSAQWKSTALLPFGKPSGPPGQPGKPAKEFEPLEKRTKFFLD